MSQNPSEDTESSTEVEAPRRRFLGGRAKVRPLDLANYLRERADELAEAWSAEIRGREVGQGDQFDSMIARFAAQLTALLPWLLGPHGSHIQPLWDRTSELFGMIGSKRGLAAGEVIEEFQILRDLLIRTLYRSPPPQGPLSLRDMLRINRIIDRGVTHASVGHTDALFFQFFEEQEAPLENSPGDIVREAETQLALVEDELSQIVEITPVEASSDAVDN
ncbi:MAG: hypothetical protein PVJ80_01885 [Gemmatimonadota bacterium]|jgi:hypothetical protein